MKIMKTLVAKNFNDMNNTVETYVNDMFYLVNPNTLAITVDLTANTGFLYEHKPFYGRLQL